MRSDALFLLPGDSPLGLRLPLEILPYVPPASRRGIHPLDPTAPRGPLPDHPGGRRSPRFPRRAVVAKRASCMISGRSAPATPDLEATEIVRTALCVEPRTVCCTFSCRRSNDWKIISTWWPRSRRRQRI